MIKIVKDPPFFPNRDSSSCNQAVIRMILKHFDPARDYTDTELDAICHAKPDKWTEDLAGPVYFAEKGMDVHYFGLAPIEDLYHNYDATITDYLGAEYLESFKKNADMGDTRAIIKKAYDLQQSPENKNFLYTSRPATIAEATDFLDKGYLLLTWVDHDILKRNNARGSGHFILIYGYITADGTKNANKFFFHNPGGFLDDGVGLNWACYGQTETYDLMLEASGLGKGLYFTAVKA